MDSFSSEENDSLLVKSRSLEKLDHIPITAGIPESRTSRTSFLLFITVVINFALVLACLYMQHLVKKSLVLKSRDIDLLPQPDPFIGLKL